MTQQFTTQQFTLTIQSGKNRLGEQEGFDNIEIRPGDTLLIVDPTGSGKSALINYIETLAHGATITGRRILINSEVPPEAFVRETAFKPIAMITQNTRCLADLSVEAFLLMHIRARHHRIGGRICPYFTTAIRQSQSRKALYNA